MAFTVTYQFCMAMLCSILRFKGCEWQGRVIILVFYYITSRSNIVCHVMKCCDTSVLLWNVC